MEQIRMFLSESGIRAKYIGINYIRSEFLLYPCSYFVIFTTFFLYFWKAIEKHIIQNEGQHILNEERKNGILCQTNRVKLIGHLCEFIFTKFGPYPEKSHKISVAKATVNLFPSLEYKADGADPIVSTHFS